MKQIIVFLFFFFIALGVGAKFYLFQPTHDVRKHVVVVPVLPEATPLPTPSTTPWISPDGTTTLIMKTTTLSNKQRSYTISVKDAATSTERRIYETTASDSARMNIPFNSWSPDNHLFFVVQKDNDQIHTLVFRADGKPFAGGTTYIDVNTAFVEKKIPYPFTEVTGWAAPTLLLVNTRSPSTTTPISFWFDVNHQSFIRLATSFQ